MERAEACARGDLPYRWAVLGEDAKVNAALGEVEVQLLGAAATPRRSVSSTQGAWIATIAKRWAERERGLESAEVDGRGAVAGRRVRGLRCIGSPRTSKSAAPSPGRWRCGSGPSCGGSSGRPGPQRTARPEMSCETRWVISPRRCADSQGVGCQQPVVPFRGRRQNANEHRTRRMPVHLLKVVARLANARYVERACELSWSSPCQF